VVERARHAELVPVCDRYRALLPEIKNRLIESAGDQLQLLIKEAADALGLLEEGEIAVGGEFELGLVADHAFYDRLRDGATEVERYAATTQPSDPDEASLLAALGRSHCGMFLVHTIEPGVGVGIADLLGSESRFVVDPRIASVAEEGTIFAARLADPPELTIAASTAFPLDQVAQDEIEADLEERFPGRLLASFHDLPPAERAEVNRIVTAATLGAMDWQLSRVLEELYPETDDVDLGGDLIPPPQPTAPPPAGGRPPRGQRPKPLNGPRRKGKRRR
jgi:hypothetical protein